MGFWSNAWDFIKGGTATDGMPESPKNTGYMQDYIRRQLDTVGGRPAPRAPGVQIAGGGQLDGRDQMQARGQMQTLADRLGGVATGNAKGAGELAVDRQVGQAQADQTARAMLARGGNTALASRDAARNSARIGLAGAGQAQQAALGDQATANSQLAGLLGGMRGQDIGVAQANQAGAFQQAGLDQQTGLANQQAQLAQTGMNQQAQLGYLAQLLGVDQAALQQDLARRQLGQTDRGILPNLLQVGGTIAAAKAGGG